MRKALSGSDYFHLLIDRKIKQFGLAGNISRVHLELDQSSDLNAVANALLRNPALKKAASVQYKLNWPFAPFWKLEQRELKCVQILKLDSRKELESETLNKPLDNENGLVSIDLCEVSDGSKHVIISMHHALFDYQGMVNFVHALNGSFEGGDFADLESSAFLKSCRNFWSMTFYMLSKGASNLGSLLRSRKSNSGLPRYDSIQLTDEESKQVEQNAWSAGSRIGTSAYLIACVGRSVNHILEKRGENAPYLFFSTPHNQRKLGTKGHLFSNRLSFLFFKLSSTNLNSNSTSVEAINHQLKAQIKERITEKYSGLMDSLRYVPLFIYEQMVNLSSNGKLASFGFSDLGKDQLAMDSFCGERVLGICQYPPVPSPPGFNVAVDRSNQKFEFVFAYVDEAISELEMEQFKIYFRDRLLGVA